MNNNDKFNQSREKFFNFLMRSPKTKSKAERYLSHTSLSAEDTEKLITEAEETGMIDDFAYACLFVDGHLMWGDAKIAFTLRQNGISNDAVLCALKEAEDEISRASELAAEWKKSGLDERKIITRLLNRGFRNSSARKALERI